MADEARHKEWRNKEYREANSERDDYIATGHNGAPRSVKLNIALYSELSLTYTETYRSGHNGADSKSVREQSPASSNLAVSAKDNRNLWIAVVFFL